MSLKPEPFSKIIFERTRSDGRHLVCHIKDGCFEFMLDGVPVRRRTLVKYLTIDEMLKQKYITQEQFDDMQSKGIFGFWNNQIAMSENEYHLAIAAQEDSNRYLAEKSRYDANNTISVFLSTRGWGDFENLVWRGDKNLPDDIILAACKDLFDNSFDADSSFDSETVLASIRQAKQQHQQSLTEQSELLTQAEQLVENAPKRIQDLFLKYKGVPDNLPDDIDHPDYWALKNYADAMWLIASHKTQG